MDPVTVTLVAALASALAAGVAANASFDLIRSWLKHEKSRDQSIDIRITSKDGESIDFTYNPSTMSEEQLKNFIATHFSSDSSEIDVGQEPDPRDDE